MSYIVILMRWHMQWFLGRNVSFAWIVKGLKLKQIVWNCVQQLNTQHIFHPLTQNTIIAFKSCAQAIFSLLEKTHTPGLQNLRLRNIFHYSTL
jgi:hypothetical protein